MADRKDKTNRYGDAFPVQVLIVLIFTTVRSEDNIALSKIATQSSNQASNLWLAGAAVDGCQNTQIESGCCAHTLGAVGRPTTAWWRVDLGQISSIDNIQIIYRANFQQRLAGYQLYVSNTTISPTDGVLCYDDSSTTLAAVQLTITHQCPYVGRYVTVYNYRNNPKRYSWYSDYAILELCEVLVYGCTIGMYGDDDCGQVCPATCYGGNCNPRTGSCLYCEPGLFGDRCLFTCSTNCTDRHCDKDTGLCFECVPGTYGSTCGQTCSINCKGRLCDKTTGHCADCVTGKFGTTCGQNCSVNCNARVCDADTGICSECIPGKFGNTCNQDCPINCKDRLCTKDRGNCIACVVGTYGSSCDQACSVNCKDKECDMTTGYCTECVSGTYGSRCGQDCSVTCKDSLCAQDTGSCMECTVGKHGASCDRDCPVHCQDGCTRNNATCIGCKAGRYDETCSLICPVTCKDFLCDQHTGHCLDCYPGRYGVVCGAECLDSCTDNICNKDDGRCHAPMGYQEILIYTLAVLCGLLVAALVACFIWQRRNMNIRNTVEQKNADTGTVHTVQEKEYTSIDHSPVGNHNVYEYEMADF